MALAYHKQLDATTSFAIWKIEESADELYSQLQLKDHETDFLSTLNNGKRNLHWLSTRALLRSMLKTDLYIDCLVDGHGKPYLANFPHRISLSHSYDYAAVMISEDKAVGIDIELIKDKIERVAKKFMTAAELSFIDQTNKIEHLYVCWCAKEAIYKLHGKRNVSFLDNIQLKPFDFAVDGQFEAALNIEGTTKSFIVNFEKFQNYMIGSVAGNSDE